MSVATMSARRILIITGIVFVITGMIFGDVFAVFVLHQNADRIGQAFNDATDAVAAKNPQAVNASFQKIGEFLENRGTKVDAHVHLIDFGFLALLLALLQPYVALPETSRRRLAILFTIGAVLLPSAVFAIHYVGLKYSPLSSIGWASILADFGGLLVIIASMGMLIGLLRRARGGYATPNEDKSSFEAGWTSRALLTGGTLLILAGFLHGAYYAAFDLDAHEERDQFALETMINASVAQQNKTPIDMHDARSVVEGYGLLQAEKAVNIAAHSHIIEFGLLSILLAFVQGFLSLSESSKRLSIILLLAGSIILPVFVLLELQLGLLAGGIADAGGLLVILALTMMLFGILRNGRQGEAR
jgi:hypothetical protein